MNPIACPDMVQLQRLLAGTLPDTERIELERHLDQCSACQHTVEGLSGATAAWAPPGPPAGSAGSPPATAAPPAAAQGLGALGVYQVVARLDGDRGLLLKAFEPRLQRYVTLRLLPPELAGAPEARQQFARTARAAASIDHENVVTIHAVDEAAPQPYLVMEFVAGSTLGERLKQTGKPSGKEVLRLGQQAAAGLAAFHRGDLVHGNIGLDTVLLEEGTGRVKLTGFGLGSATRPGEQAPDEARRADLKGLGAVLFALCTGQELSEGTDPKRALRSAPPWLRELVLSLLAGSGQALPTAAEVAEQLRSQLITQQAPPPGARRLLSPAKRKRRRRIGVTLLLLLALAGVGVSEALGTTRLVAAAIPLIRGTATLVIELEDPQARVTLAGYDVELSEPQTREISLRPGDYLLRLAREGWPPQEQQVSLGWAGRQEVAVRAQPRQVRERPFVVRSRRGFRDREYRTLAEAVRQVRGHDVIEIHGSGPFTSPPVALGSKPLTIRAGPGFRPVIDFEHQSGKGTFVYLASSAALVLEGIDLRIAGMPKYELGNPGHIVVRVAGAPFHVAHCRIIVKGTGDGLQAVDSPECVLRHSEVIRNKNSAHALLSFGSIPNSGRIDISNSILAGGHWGLMLSRKSLDARDVSVRLHGNTLSARVPVILTHWHRELPADDGKAAPISLELSANVIDSSEEFFRFNLGGYKADEKVVTPAQAETLLPRLVRWQMRDNLLPEGVNLLRCVQELHTLLPGWRERKTLAEWNQFWGLPPTHSLQGRPLFADDKLAIRQVLKPEEVTADDFKLQPESPGRGLGSGRKDLGAPVAEVGPGPAYERWQKTPDYREWLKKTGQIP